MRRRGPLGEDADVNKAWGRPIPAPPPLGSLRPPPDPKQREAWLGGLGLAAVSGRISRDQGQPRRFRKFGAPGKVVRAGLAVAAERGTEDVALTRGAGRLNFAQEVLRLRRCSYGVK
ncbi:hypothetical protein QTO34_007580 [Cnephaeus nilssonii]|uniref:Uncharacterized protein n=1 Tax=Cnephaeus nilssonii TaxID=3371016 RepID=A0AA40LHJ6_CNENI|nr:hypothetical protein QTO34_007580 [Eptesicus nilssonii]